MLVLGTNASSSWHKNDRNPQTCSHSGSQHVDLLAAPIFFFFVLLLLFMSQYLSDFFFVFHDYFRWIWRDPLNDLTGVHACAANVRRWGAHALHLRGSQFWPSDGDGDCSLRVTHGQRQPAHLAIDKPSHRPKYGLTSYYHNMTEDAGDSFWLQTWYRTRKLKNWCIMDT